MEAGIAIGQTRITNIETTDGRHKNPAAMMRAEKRHNVSQKRDPVLSPANSLPISQLYFSLQMAFIILSIVGLLPVLMLTGCRATGTDYDAQRSASLQSKETAGIPQFVNFTLPNGDTYQGYLVAGLLQGTGTYTWPNGDVYEGEFKQDRIDGEGKFTFVDGHSYEGHLKQGMFHGTGTHVYADGTIYTGSFKNNKLHGQGMLQYPTGDVYVGQFANNTMHGKGIYRTKGGTILKGLFVNGEYRGE